MDERLMMRTSEFGCSEVERRVGMRSFVRSACPI
jgi:hypothetical protein